jgi:hypothetical protein
MVEYSVFDSVCGEYQMPRARHASRKRSRALSPAKTLAKVRAAAFDMEEPLNEAIDYIVAVRLIGIGLTTLDNDHGRAILATAWSLSKRLDTLKSLWKKIFADVAKHRASRP